MRLSMTRRVCASMPSGNGLESSSGQVGICPVTKSQPSVSTAWLKGATGVGAPEIIWKVGEAMTSTRMKGWLGEPIDATYHSRCNTGLEATHEYDRDQECGLDYRLERRQGPARVPPRWRCRFHR